MLFVRTAPDGHETHCCQVSSFFYLLSVFFSCSISPWVWLFVPVFSVSGFSMASRFHTVMRAHAHSTDKIAKESKGSRKLGSIWSLDSIGRCLLCYALSSDSMGSPSCYIATLLLMWYVHHGVAIATPHCIPRKDRSPCSECLLLNHSLTQLLVVEMKTTRTAAYAAEAAIVSCGDALEASATRNDNKITNRETTTS